MTEERKVLYSGPIGALLGTDEDYAAARAALGELTFLSQKCSPEEMEEIVGMAVALMVEVREAG